MASKVDLGFFAWFGTSILGYIILSIKREIGLRKECKDYIERYWNLKERYEMERMESTTNLFRVRRVAIEDAPRLSDESRAALGTTDYTVIHGRIAQLEQELTTVKSRLYEQPLPIFSWDDIVHAPKDGTGLLLAYWSPTRDHFRAIAFGWYCPIAECWRFRSPRGVGHSEQTDYFDAGVQPTHFAKINRPDGTEYVFDAHFRRDEPW